MTLMLSVYLHKLRIHLVYEFRQYWVYLLSLVLTLVLLKPCIPSPLSLQPWRQGRPHGASQTVPLLLRTEMSPFSLFVNRVHFRQTVKETRNIGFLSILLAIVDPFTPLGDKSPDAPYRSTPIHRKRYV